MNNSGISGKRLLVSFLIAESIFLSAFNLPAFTQDASSLNARGSELLNAGKILEAINTLEQAVRINPKYDSARRNLGVAYNNYGLQLANGNKAEQALPYFQKAAYYNDRTPIILQNLDNTISYLGKNPQNPKDRKELGEQAQRSGNLQGAVTEYKASLKLKADPAVGVKLGEAYRILGEDDNAVQALKESLAMGETADAQIRLGQTYLHMKDVANAVQCFTRAAQLKSDDKEVGDLLVKAWEEACAIDPTSVDNYLGLCNALIIAKKYDQAQAALNTAMAMNRNHPLIPKLVAEIDRQKKLYDVNRHLELGAEYFERKMWKQALDEYQIAQGKDPKNPDILINIGSTYQRMGEYAQARNYYTQALSLAPAGSKANQLAMSAVDALNKQEKQKQYDDAIKAASDAFAAKKYQEAASMYLALLKENEKDPQMHFNVGACFQAMGQIDQAIAEYKIAIGIDPKNTAFIDALDGALNAKIKPIREQAIQEHTKKNYAQAISLYQNILSIKPTKDPSLYYNLASAYYSMQDYVRARDAYNNAIKLDAKKEFPSLFFLATIDEHESRGRDALSKYQQYLAEMPMGDKANDARSRIDVLKADPLKTQRILSEAEQATIAKAEDAYQKGLKQQEAKDYSQAKASFEEAIRIKPEEALYVGAMGWLMLDQKLYDDALFWYEKAAKMDDKNADYKKAIIAIKEAKAAPLFDQAVKLQTEGNPEAAIPLYLDVLKILPESGKMHGNLGTAYQNADLFSQAYQEYTQAVKLDPKGDSQYYYFMGQIAEHNSQAMQAIRHYQDYITKQPGGTYAQAARDRIKALQVDPGKTQKLLTRSELKTGKEFDAAYDDATAKQTAGNYQEALASYQKALSIKPNDTATIYGLGTLYHAMGDFDKAIETYKKALAIYPNNVNTKKALDAAIAAKSQPLMDEGIKRHSSGDLAGAVEQYLQYLKLMPNDAHAYTNLGGAYQQMDEFQKAKEAYEKGYSLDGKNEADNLYFIAQIEEHFGQGNPAFNHYNQYLLQPNKKTYRDLAQARFNVLKNNVMATQKLVTQADARRTQAAETAFSEAVKFQNESKFDEAIAEYQKAIAIDKTNASYWYSLGTAYHGKNDIDNAINAYTEASRLNPKEASYKQYIPDLKMQKAEPFVESAIKKQTTPDEKTGQPDLQGAIIDYEKALQIFDAASTHMNLGTAYQGVNNLDKAISEYARAVKMDPKLVECYYYIATAYEAKKDNASALLNYEKYVQVAPAGENAPAAKGQIQYLKTIVKLAPGGVKKK